MKLRTLRKLNHEAVTHYTVWKGREYVEAFTVDYTAPPGKDNLRKQFELEDAGATIKSINVHPVKKILEVAVYI